MPTFFATLLAHHRHRRCDHRARRQATLPAHTYRSLRLRLPAARAEDGLLLIEVVISALIVGLIVVGTFTGLDVAQGTSISERDHNEASLLATESQEALRSDPASAFDSPTNSYEHTYGITIDGEKYEVKQQASFLTNTGESTACSATNTTRQESNSVRLISTVTWPQQVAAGRAPITVSGTTTPPAASALEVDVGNYPTPTAGVTGVTTEIKYLPNESPPETSLQGTTEAAGCVVFASVPSTAATVEVAEKAGFVTPAGEWKWPTKEVTIAPNYTTHDPVTLNEGGAITAEFSFKGSTGEYSHSKNTTGTMSEPVTADAFIAYNELMESAPNFVVGSAKYTNPSGTYTNTFGTSETATWAHAITTPLQASKYANGNLFPFPNPGAWKVYGGACTANDPHVLSSSLTDPTAYVLGTKATAVTVPLGYLKLNVYSGTSSAHGSLVETTEYPALITNTGCKNITPNDGAEYNEPKESEKTTTSTTSPGYGGHLPHPFLPLGPGKLCVGPSTVTVSGHTKHFTFTNEYSLKSETTVYERNIYIGQTSAGTYEETIGSESGVKVTVAEASECK
jgi:Tfp pilus assembly protein PilV